MTRYSACFIGSLYCCLSLDAKNEKKTLKTDKSHQRKILDVFRPLKNFNQIVIFNDNAIYSTWLAYDTGGKKKKGNRTAS
jgi:hypothetical protein